MFDYYKTPSDKIFDDMKRVAIGIWNTYDNTYGYVDEKVEIVNGMQNIRDNIRCIYGMFDHFNQQKVKSLVERDTLDLIYSLDDYNRSLTI